MSIHFLNPGSINQISGGYIFNKKFIEGLKSNGKKLELFEIETLKDYSPSENEVADLVIIDSLLFFKNPRHTLELIQKHNVIPIIHLSDGLQDVTYRAVEKNLLQDLKILVTSEFVKSELVRYFSIGEENILVLEPGIETNFSKPNYPSKIKDFICVSNLVKRKRVLALINILNDLIEFNWTLQIYGDDKIEPLYAEKLRNFIKQNNLEERVRISAALPQEELFKKMAEKDMLLHFAAYETFGMSIFEAAAIGLPILSTKTGAWEALKLYPLAGFIELESEFKYKEALKHILTSEHQSIDLSTFKLPFTWERVSNKFLSWLC